LRHDTDRDHVLTADTAREYGIVDEVIQHRAPAAVFQHPGSHPTAATA
jgi:ATP-dependent Clp protease protease subunit